MASEQPLIWDVVSEEILACAERLAKQKHTQKLTVRDVLREMDITNRVFYNRFHNIDEVLELVYQKDPRPQRRAHGRLGVRHARLCRDLLSLHGGGRSAIFEWVAGTDATDTDGSARQLVITYNDQDAQIGENEGSSDAQWVTNFVIQPGYYDNEENQKGLDRYRHIEGQLMAAGGVLADERATMDALASVGRRSWNNNSGEHLTIHSAVYNLTDKTVVWVPNENYNDPEAWFTFAL